jgi:hypothetical protein
VDVDRIISLQYLKFCLFMQPDKWKLASSDMIQISKTDFIIIHNVQELHTEIRAQSFILYLQFMGYVNFVQMNSRDFMQNPSKEPA